MVLFYLVAAVFGVGPESTLARDHQIIIGRWIHLQSRQIMELRHNGDVFDEGQGQGVWSDGLTCGNSANLCIEFSELTCAYRFVVIDRGNVMALKLLYQHSNAGNKCPVGSFTRVDE
jgi:hypothetical protein